MKKLSFVALILCAVSFAQTNVARMLSGVNAQTGTSYTFVASDVTKIVTFNNANPVGATLLVGTTTGFGAGSVFTAVNLGVGTVTITCSGCTINGAATVQIVQNQSVSLYGDGTNYISASGGGGGGSSISGSTALGTQVGGNGAGGFASTSKPVIDVRDLGVDCSGSVAADPILNALTGNPPTSNNAITGRTLSFGNCPSVKLANTWVIYNQAGFILDGLTRSGAAGKGINLTWSGGASPMLDMEYTDGFQVQGFNFQGNSAATVGVQIDKNGAGGIWNATDGRLVNNTYQGANQNWIGVSISPVSQNNVEDMRIEDSAFYCNATRATTNAVGIMVGNSANAKNEIFRHNNITQCLYGIYAKSGSFQAKDGEFTSNGGTCGSGSGADIRIDTSTDVDIIEGNLDENSTQGINVNGDSAGSGPGHPVIVRGNHNAPASCENTANYWYNVPSGYYWIFEGNSWDVDTNLVKVIGSNTSGGANNTSIYTSGNRYPNSVFTPWWTNGAVTSGNDTGLQDDRMFAYSAKSALQPSVGNNASSPILGFRGYLNGSTGSPDDVDMQNIPASGTGSSGGTFLIKHEQGTTGNQFLAWDGLMPALTLASIATPAVQAVTPQGAAGAVGYTYAVVAYGPAGNTAGSAGVATTTGNATLTTSNFNRVTWYPVGGATKYCIWRTASAGNPASLGNIGCTSALQKRGTTFPFGYTANVGIVTNPYRLDDTGLAGDSATLPTINTTGKIITAASTTGSAGLNLPHGSAPTTPIDGDFWTTTAGAFVRINGGTIGPLSAGGGGGLSGMTTLGMPIATSPTNIATSTVPGTNQGTYVVGRFNSVQGVATSPIEIQAGDCSAPGVISGATTTYTIIYTDVINCNVTHDIAASQSATITIPPPATLNNPAPVFVYSNYSTHTDTLTPSTYQISMGASAAGASLSVPTGVSCKVELDYVNGTTYKADCHPMSASTPTVTFSGSTTTAVSAGAGVNSAAVGTALIADGSGNAIPRAAVATVGLGGVWSNGMPLGMPANIGPADTLVNGTMYVQQVNLMAEQTIGNATFDMTACSSCAEVINACMYNSAGTTLLWSGISATINGTGAFSATGTQATLTRGVYYFAYSASGGGASVIQGYTAGASTTDNILNKNGVREGTAANGISGGACPATLGVLTGTLTAPAHGSFALEP